MRFDYEKDGVVVFRKETNNPNLTYFAGRGIVTAPYADVAEFVKDPESAFIWDKFLIVCNPAIKALRCICILLLSYRSQGILRHLHNLQPSLMS